MLNDFQKWMDANPEDPPPEPDPDYIKAKRLAQAMFPFPAEDAPRSDPCTVGFLHDTTSDEPAILVVYSQDKSVETTDMLLEVFVEQFGATYRICVNADPMKMLSQAQQSDSHPPEPDAAATVLDSSLQRRTHEIPHVSPAPLEGGYVLVRSR